MVAADARCAELINQRLLEEANAEMNATQRRDYRIQNQRNSFKRRYFDNISISVAYTLI